MRATPELVVDCRGALLESLHWMPETGQVWFLDLLGPAVHRFHPASGWHERRELPGTLPPGCLYPVETDVRGLLEPAMQG